MAAPLVAPAYDMANPRFVDGLGQQVLLRGVNIASTAPSSVYQMALTMGVNFIRIGVYWDTAESSAPAGSGTTWSSYTHSYDESYLLGVDAIVDWAAANGIMVQIDSHQAGWSPAAPFKGFHGIPSWYYTDSRFPGAQTLSGPCGTAPNPKSCTIKAWWTDPAEIACNQLFYTLFWQMLAARYATRPNVVLYQVFNEPNAGAIGGTSPKKVDTMHRWLAPIVTAIHAVDSQRGICIMCSGGGQGFGTATFAAFGGGAGMRATNMVLEYHMYYTGLGGGWAALQATVDPADPAYNPDGPTGYDVAGDKFIPTSFDVHTTVQTPGAYHGSARYQENFHQVPIQCAARLGVPLFVGEWGVNAGDTGRAAYQSDMFTVFDAHKLSCTRWLLEKSKSPNDNNLLASDGSLSDSAVQLQTWFTSTRFVNPTRTYHVEQRSDGAVWPLLAT